MIKISKVSICTIIIVAINIYYINIAESQMVTCVDKNGKKTYSNTTCPSGYASTSNNTNSDNNSVSDSKSFVPFDMEKSKAIYIKCLKECAVNKYQSDSSCVDSCVKVNDPFWAQVKY